jgi:hypothetical protein
LVYSWFKLNATSSMYLNITLHANETLGQYSMACGLSLCVCAFTYTISHLQVRLALTPKTLDSTLAVLPRYGGQVWTSTNPRYSPIWIQHAFVNRAREVEEHMAISLF